MSLPSVAELNTRFQGLTAPDLVRVSIGELFPGKIALVSSFGTEAAVLLHMVSVVDKATPVIFLDTFKHFGETLEYRDRLINRLRLTDVRTVQPLAEDLTAEDPDGLLWASSTDACCDLRKVRPLNQAVEPFEALFNGRKRHHGLDRSDLAAFEEEDGRIKVNPLFEWGPKAVEIYLQRYGLPRHPLADQGYASVGCAVCTSPVAPGETFRAGRWRGTEKTECGIHNVARAR